MLKNQHLLTLLIRLFLGYIFFSAGVCKLTHGNFGQLIGPPWLEESLARYGLGFFAQVVAVCQVLIGTLLMSQRFSLLGAVMLVPMNIAILAVTISMNWAGTPYVNAVFLLLNFVLLGLEYRKFLYLLQPAKAHNTVPVQTDSIGQDIYSWLGIGFCVVTLLFTFVDYTLTNVAALLAFVSFAVTIVRSGLLSKLDVVLILLPFAAMLLLTYASISPLLIQAIVPVIGIEALLLTYRLYLGSRVSTTQDVVPTTAIS